MLGLIIFLVCTWAVFSKSVDDGFIGRHMLVFSAIFAAGYSYSGDMLSFFISYMLLLCFALWYTLRSVLRLAHVSKQ